jgi:hypothetical protein
MVDSDDADERAAAAQAISPGARRRSSCRSRRRAKCFPMVRARTTVESSTTANAVSGSTPTIDRTLTGSTEPSGRRSWS